MVHVIICKFSVYDIFVSSLFNDRNPYDIFVSSLFNDRFPNGILKRVRHFARVQDLDT